jgi:DNA mismatch endonuclease (patch repair protein)
MGWKSMADRLSTEDRSILMAKVRSVDTGPKLVVRRLVHCMGYRYRLHRRDLPGAPDLVFPSLKKIILVHGCFWHRHAGCMHARMPASRTEYWSHKFDETIKRDAQYE